MIPTTIQAGITASWQHECPSAYLDHTFEYILLGVIGPFVEERFGLSIPISNPTSLELMVVGGFILLGTLSGLIPAIKAYRNSLHNGLSSN